MRRDEELFLSLLRSALWGIPVVVSGCDAGMWERVYRLSQLHTVQGLVYDVVKELPADAGVPRQLAARWMLETRSIETRNRHLSMVAEKQSAIWKRLGIDAVMLKGLKVAGWYRIPEHRITGDIDWWFPGTDGWEMALKAVCEMGIEVSVDSDRDICYTFEGVTIEHHRKGFVCEGPLGWLMLLNTHILHHAQVTGIGMRHVCDLAIGYKVFKGAYDDAEYENMLARSGLLRWTVLLHGAMDRLLNLPEGVLPVFGRKVKVKDSSIDRLAAMFMSDGNFGLHRKRRFAGLFGRIWLFMRCSPCSFVKRWAGLLAGRVQRSVTLF
ncbi:MAG: nucleotidyltransferase family protein [Bacteroidaceae bacterium]|nr:nucleotidyltransferase family protein [Bacteroidaceae bacterium]